MVGHRFSGGLTLAKTIGFSPLKEVRVLPQALERSQNPTNCCTPEQAAEKLETESFRMMLNAHPKLTERSYRT
jgi:hypothetical protein